MKPALNLRLHQQLALTPQLQQAIRLLQLSSVELEMELREALESNPLLELPEESGEAAPAEAANGAEAPPPEFETRATGNARLWVVNPDNDSVTVFDAVTNAKLAEVGVGTAPRAIAVAPNGRIWVTNRVATVRPRETDVGSSVMSSSRSTMTRPAPAESGLTTSSDSMGTRSPPIQTSRSSARRSATGRPPRSTATASISIRRCAFGGS